MNRVRARPCRGPRATEGVRGSAGPGDEEFVPVPLKKRTAFLPTPIVAIASELFLQDPPDPITCVVCLEVPISACTRRCPNCDRISCSACYSKRRSAVCPICHKSAGWKEGMSPCMNHLTGTLDVRCPHPSCGVTAKGTDHITTCPFRPGTCPLCDARLLARGFDSHIESECPERDVRCTHCSKEMPASARAQHVGECPSWPVNCSHPDCGSRVPRSQLGEHEQQCTKRAVLCPLCPDEMPREKLVQHLDPDSTGHMSSVAQFMAEVRGEFTAMKSEIAELKRQLGSAGPQTVAPGNVQRVGGEYIWSATVATEAGLTDLTHRAIATLTAFSLGTGISIGQPDDGYESSSSGGMGMGLFGGSDSSDW